MVCGHFELDRSLDHPLLNALPAMIHIKNNDQQEMDWIGTTSRLIIQESSRRQPGSGIILEKLAEVLLVHVFRAYFKQENHNNGFAHALIHPNVSRAIDALHNQPTYPWTLALLAKEAGLSRTAFAVLFKQLTGSTPMQYCLNWRMTLAHQFLRNSTWSIPDLAERVGYQSEAAFSRAFKRCFSITPGRVRRNSKNASHNSMVIE
ncbi:MAG: AraC family transcriptional regulator [Rhodothermales bacterium]